MTLSSRDVELLQRAALALHEPRDLDGFREAAPAIFKQAIPADYFLRLEFGQGSAGQMETITALWEDPARAGLEFVQKAIALAATHPFTEYVLRTGDLGPLRLSDFWTRRQQLASRVHGEVYAHLGIGWMLTVTVVRGGRPEAVNLTRPFQAPDFSERDRELLRLLAPHFVLAIGAAERVSSHHAAVAEALAGLGLTQRERDVATWLARGRSNHEIAALVTASPRTVEKHVERILLKLGVENRTTAAQVILRLGTVSGLPAAPGRTRAHVALRRVLKPVRARGRR